MTNLERLNKLRQAEKLIREVEFSYPIDYDVRRIIYKARLQTFNHGAYINIVMEHIKNEILLEKNQNTVNDHNTD